MILISKNMRVTILLITMIFWASACTLSLAEDVMPPPGSELSAESTKKNDIEYPQNDIDINEGAKIYAQSCAPCHGLGGLGDGEQADQLPFQVPPIGERSFAREHSLEEWYLRISEGNIDRFMPPFSLAYSVQERWNVLAYVIGLGLPSEASVSSEALNLSKDIGTLSDIAPLTGAELYEIIASKSGDLSGIDIWSQVDQVQMLALEIETPIDITIVHEASALVDLPESIAINGQVINASGGTIPQELDITLHIVKDGQEAETQAYSVDPNGAFAISEINLIADYIYFFSIDFQSLKFFSAFFSAESLNEIAMLEIEIFESSRDTSQLEIEIINLVIDFPSEGVARIVEQIVISNHGAKAAAPGDGGIPLINFLLPKDASQLTFQQGVLGERYAIQENGFGDVRAVLPGKNSYEMIFSYQVPYSDSVEIEIALPGDGHSISVFLPQGNVRPDASFAYSGQQLIQAEIFETFAYSDNLQASESLSFTIQGIHPLEKSLIQRLRSDRNFLNGLIAFTISIGLIWGWYRNIEAKQQGANENLTEDALLDEIVALDKIREDGQISIRKYSKLRAGLLDDLRRKVEKGLK